MLFLYRIQRNTCPTSQMKERTDGNALSFGLQAMGVLLVRLFPLIVRMKPTDTVIIFSSVLAQSVNQGKAQFHPILIFRCDVNGTLFYFANDTFHIYLFIIRGWIWRRK